VVCATQVIVVRAPSDPVDLRCGGHAMLPLDAAPSGSLELSGDHAAGTAVGKRFVDDATGLEVLCTKAGEGSLSLGDVPLARKDAKPLPSSD
jgi:hypothetical protein